MPNILSFSEDMLPRHFPKAHYQKTAEQSEKTSVVPQPTLPGVSLLFTDEKHIPKFEPKKSFQKWKEQHGAIFTNNSSEHQIKSAMKQVRFKADNTVDHYNSKRRSLPTDRTQPSVSPNLELSYYKCPNSLGSKAIVRHPHNQAYTKGFERNMRSVSTTTPKCEFVNNSLSRPQSKINFRRYDQVQKSESMKENGLSRSFGMTHHNQKQSDRPHVNRNCSPMKENCCKITNHQATNTRFNSVEMPVEQREQLIHEFEPSVGLLINILEEQQQHIALQQNQISMHEKQNSEQQNQIYILQHRIQQLLLPNESNGIHSPPKGYNPIISDEITTDVLKNKNGSMNYGLHILPSIGVMSNSMNNVNDFQKFNEKLFSNIGASDEYSSANVLLDRTSNTIRNSSTMFDYDYRMYEHVSPNRHSELNNYSNITTAQTLICDSLSTNSSYVNGQKTVDRSFALNMLGMKYKCIQDDIPKNTDERGLYYAQQGSESSIKSNDCVSGNITSDTYDYLVRHGLMKS